MFKWISLIIVCSTLFCYLSYTVDNLRRIVELQQQETIKLQIVLNKIINNMEDYD
jgi:hypothetical protein